MISNWTVFYFSDLLFLGRHNKQTECLTFEMRPVPRSTAGTVRRICQATLPLLMYLCVTAYYLCVCVQIYILKECVYSVHINKETIHNMHVACQRTMHRRFTVGWWRIGGWGMDGWL